MSCKNRIAIALVVAAAAGGAGCGNYSNEDLDFINALPEKNDVATTIPAVGAVATADQAELYQTTRGVIGAFNGMVDRLLALIDGIRSYSPTSRMADVRIWGPFPSADHPGWDVRMTITRQPDQVTYAYAIEFRPSVPGSDAESGWVTPSLISGSFTGSQGVRKGIGTVTMDTSALRAAGFDFGTDFLNAMTVMYDTGEFPVTVTLDFTNLPDPSRPDAATQGQYTYAVAQNGQGAFMFDFFANSIPGPAAIEEFNVTSRWLGSGAGRADLQVVSGNGAGLQQTECWNDHFMATYNDKPWSTAEDVGGDPSVCPAIPSL